MANFTTHIQRGQPAFMGALALFALIEGCVTAWLLSQYNRGNPDTWSHSLRDRLRFLCFTSWWTFVFSLAYIAAFFTAATSVISSIASHFIFVFLTWLFWLAGTASLTSSLGGGVDCGGREGSFWTHCNQLAAAMAFGWIEWIIISCLLILLFVIGGAAMRRGDRISVGIAA